MSRRLLEAIGGRRSNLSADTSGAAAEKPNYGELPGLRIRDGRTAAWGPGGRKGAVTVQSRIRAGRVPVDRGDGSPDVAGWTMEPTPSGVDRAVGSAGGCGGN